MNNYCTNCETKLDENKKCPNCKNILTSVSVKEEKEAKKYGSITIGMFLTTLVLFILEKIYKYEYLKIINPLFLIATCLLFLYTIERFNNVNSGKIFPIKFIKALKSLTLSLILIFLFLFGFLYLSCYIPFKNCD